MSALPSSVALTTIADSSSIIASDHRNNYSAVQTAINALIAALSAGVSGQTLGGNGTTVTYAYPPGYEMAYAEITANVSVTATLSATANSVVASAATVYDGTPVWVEFFAPKFATGTGLINLVLYDGATEICTLGGFTSAADPVLVRRKVSPTAASHTYTVKAYVDAGTGTVSAGAGTIGVFVPAFIRVTKA